MPPMAIGQPSVAMLPSTARLIPDVMVLGESAAVVIEIKSDGSYASLYEAIGQLGIYSGLYCPVGFTSFKAVVMPEPPKDPDVTRALDKMGIRVFAAKMVGEKWKMAGLKKWLAGVFESD